MARQQPSIFHRLANAQWSLKSTTLRLGHVAWPRLPKTKIKAAFSSAVGGLATFFKILGELVYGDDISLKLLAIVILNYGSNLLAVAPAIILLLIQISLIFVCEILNLWGYPWLMTHDPDWLEEAFDLFVGRLLRFCE